MILNKIKDFAKSQAVLTAAMAAAVISCFFVHPDIKYLDYIDLKVISLLFCLMAVVAGLMKMNLFDIISHNIIRITSDMKKLTLFIVNITFFLSMFLTNDVALIAVVPFTIGLFAQAGNKNLLKVIILETAAANLGSMLMPFGNPQNLYLYSHYDLAPGEFIMFLLPSAVLSIILVNISTLILVPSQNIISESTGKTKIKDTRRFVIYILLFVLCVLTVLRVVSPLVCLCCVVTAVLMCDYKLLARVDYGLLATFAAFFIFVGNLTRIDFISENISRIIGGNEFLCGLLLSQFISNVPAAIMLCEFTDNARGLLLGVDIGGLGTIVASLASVISYKYYLKTKNADSKSYILGYLCLSAVFLIFLVTGVFITKMN
ncbi:MAG: SLC13 family permease [Oscillospiraceae bacterium]|nr:SLC13 family permease [Oscillospiraceae bacterium]